MIPAQVSIPIELLQDPGPPLIIFLLCLTIVTIGKWWREAEKKWETEREARNTDSRTAAGAVSEQQVLNVKAAARIELLEYQRDEAVRREEKCLLELNALRYGPSIPKEAP